ncbi:hypothetical protein DFP73DRAFT_66026 [Morchella snyderi]|nr:hypothetical protein DFP73DRAFT_66026 [Morchella snyderi]
MGRAKTKLQKFLGHLHGWFFAVLVVYGTDGLRRQTGMQRVGTRCSARGQLGREEHLACACRGLVQMNGLPQSLRSPSSGVRMRETYRSCLLL